MGYTARPTERWIRNDTRCPCAKSLNTRPAKWNLAGRLSQDPISQSAIRGERIALAAVTVRGDTTALRFRIDQCAGANWGSSTNYSRRIRRPGPTSEIWDYTVRHWGAAQAGR